MEKGNFFWSENGKVETAEEKKVKQSRGMFNIKFSLQDHIKNEIWYPAFILKDINIKIKRGTLTSIIGKIGSGKSSFLQAILGEMPIYADDGDLKNTNMSLQINGSVSYLSQTPWLLETTVQENIIMNKPYDKNRLNQAIKYSALDIDLKTWDDGLLHKIGSGGALISGGQKARIAFARCLYRDSDIYILDDIVSALDSGVAAFIMKETIGKYLRGKTIILTTHNLSTLPYSDHVIYMENGHIQTQGKFELMKGNVLWEKHLELINSNKKMIEEDTDELADLDTPQLQTNNSLKLSKNASVDLTNINSKSLRVKQDEQTEKEKMDARKKILEAVGKTAKWLNKNVGIIDWEMVAYPLSFMGGIQALIINICFSSLSTVFEDYSSQYLSLWGEDFEAQTKFSYLIIFTCVTMARPIIQNLVDFFEEKKANESSEVIKRVIFYRILHAKIQSFYDKYSTSYILSKKENSPTVLMGMVYMIIDWVNNSVRIAVCLYSVKKLFNPLTISLLVYYIYDKNKQTQKQQIFSKNHQIFNTRINKIRPNIFKECLKGLVEIRAMGMEDYMESKSYKSYERQDSVNNIVNSVYQMIWTKQNILDALFLDIPLYVSYLFVGNLLLIEKLSLMMLYIGMVPRQISAIFNMKIQYDRNIQNLDQFREVVTLPIEEGYDSFDDDTHKLCKLDQTKCTQMLEEFKTKVIASTLKNGNVEFKNVFARYEINQEIVLKNLSFKIAGGSKIGVVGRSGSGKSSFIKLF